MEKCVEISMKTRQLDQQKNIYLQEQKDITPYATLRFVCKNKTVFAASHKTKLVFADYAK